MLYGCITFGPKELAPMLVLWLLISSGLLLIIRGICQGKKRSYIWYCYILLMYFTFNVVFLFSGGTEDQASALTHEIVAMVAIVVGFIAAMMASRLASS
tara:strand:+ start:391 stop:687 length:297 start_codon:yes stop_codon:yes gene_type:complete